MDTNFRLTLLVALFVLSPCNLVDSEVIKENYPAERDGLLQLRDSVSSTIDLHSNWTGPTCINNESKWFGVACSDWHVVGLVLEGIQLTGSLPPEFLQDINYLTRLNFRNNLISGQLPDLTNLAQLEYVLLSSNQFMGSVPFGYVELPSLMRLELQDNFLNGEIPPFDQPSLKGFNVSYNQLEGPIPETGILQSFPQTSYDHNSNLCGSPLKPCPVPPAPSPTYPPLAPRDKKNKLKIWNIVLIAAAAALVPFIVMFFFLCSYKKARGKETTKASQTVGAGSLESTDEIAAAHSHSTDDPERAAELEFLDTSIPIFDLDDLLGASAEVLGKGKLGTTYRATLESESVVAVKKFKNMKAVSKKDFMQQMQLLGKMRHENLVKLVSFYYSKEEKLVICEFVPHGNLFELLHDNRGRGREPLAWTARLSIMKDIAKGLAYLHQSLPSHKVPHANLKSSNVLIRHDGQDYHSKLTDYGFLPLLPPERPSQRIAVCRSPEFCQGKRLTHKADVYCFGIILLEVLTARIPNDISPGNEERTDDLSEWVRETVSSDWSTDILDEEILAAREDHDDMMSLTGLALECTDEAPERRPEMSEVLRRIQEIEQKHNQNDQRRDN